jgi:hypothetical protein
MAVSEAAMDERRIGLRQKSFLQGRVFYNNRMSSIDCLVRDISGTGARLKFPGPVVMPESVELFIPNKNESYRCEVQWNRGDEIGVAFLRDESEAAAAAPVSEGNLAERLHRLEAEVAGLKRIVRELKERARGDAA